jgi:hypothetical protein
MSVRDLLFLSAWCGLAAGLMEVGTRVLCRAINPSQRLYLMKHHFIWLSPLANLTFLSSGSIERRYEPGSLGAFHSCSAWSAYSPALPSPGIG